MLLGIHLSTFRRPTFEEALDAVAEQEREVSVPSRGQSGEVA